MAIQLQIRRGTAALWAVANPILAQGELGLETDTFQLKAGDGVTSWNSLPYVPTNSSAFNQANAAYAQANAAANTVATFANGTLVLADANLNFNNTATVNVIITANGTTSTNCAFGANTRGLFGFNTQNSNYTLALTDAFGMIYHNVATSCAYNVNTMANVAFSLGTRIYLRNGAAAGNINVAPLAGVTLRTSNTTLTGNCNIAANVGGVLELVETNVWYCSRI